ncbi:MAG: response regulator [Chitinophagaceae bacterium]|nr:response regulator [Chitinophagaceae bacterium]
MLLKLGSAKKLPDIILMDIEMPKIDGLLCTTYINFKYPEIKIIGISSHSNQALVTAVLSEGAISFLSKHFCEPDSISYKPTYGSRNILKETIVKAIANQKFIDSLLFNNTNNIELFKSTKEIRKQKIPNISAQLTEFLVLNTANLSLKDIGRVMHKSEASIKHYQAQATELFELSTRNEIASHCIKHGYVKLPSYYDNTHN